MKNINKEQITKFINSKEGKKTLLFVGIGILIAVLWKTLLIIGLVVGLGYLIMRCREKKKKNNKVPIH